KVSGIEKITADLVESLKIKNDGQGDKIGALDKAVQNLVNFIESGGEVDFIIPDEETEDEDGNGKGPNYGNLRITFQEIRQLETKIKLLESSNT
ncbi:MAG: hypothetical protein GY833_16950, partial [Aestuariibacter sp.]|nr:hypothetical protein [Aestuariibacter sp.]